MWHKGWNGIIGGGRKEVEIREEFGKGRKL
jgi:hypothetical protein